MTAPDSGPEARNEAAERLREAMYEALRALVEACEADLDIGEPRADDNLGPNPSWASRAVEAGRRYEAALAQARALIEQDGRKKK